MFERRGKQYSDMEGRSLKWERAVTGTKAMHNTLIILNILN
jgi:hypothetical protein